MGMFFVATSTTLYIMLWISKSKVNKINRWRQESIELNSEVPEVKIPFIFSIGFLITSHKVVTIQGRLTTSYEVVKQWYAVLFTISQISTTLPPLGGKAMPLLGGAHC